MISCFECVHVILLWCFAAGQWKLSAYYDASIKLRSFLRNNTAKVVIQISPMGPIGRDGDWAVLSKGRSDRSRTAARTRVEERHETVILSEPATIASVHDMDVRIGMLLPHATQDRKILTHQKLLRPIASGFAWKPYMGSVYSQSSIHVLSGKTKRILCVEEYVTTRSCFINNSCQVITYLFDIGEEFVWECFAVSPQSIWFSWRFD